MMEKSNNKMKPFVAGIPANGEKYVPVLNRENASILKSGVVTLQPGEAIGTHNTEDKEELILILEGKGTVVTEDTGETAVGTGQIAFNPSDTEHNVINTGEEVLRYIYIVARSEVLGK